MTVKQSFKTRTVHRFDLARCQHGRVGLVLSDSRTKDGRRIVRGVHVDPTSPEQMGMPWQSVRPTFVAHARDVLRADDAGVVEFDPTAAQVIEHHIKQAREREQDA